MKEYFTVEQISKDENFELQEIDTDIESIREYLSIDKNKEYDYFYVKVDNADISEVYGTIGLPYLSARVDKLYQKED